MSLTLVPLDAERFVASLTSCIQIVDKMQGLEGEQLEHARTVLGAELHDQRRLFAAAALDGMRELEWLTSPNATNRIARYFNTERET